MDLYTLLYSLGIVYTGGDKNGVTEYKCYDF
jgi:hypothetical protein